jgi:hypothetical protein
MWAIYRFAAPRPPAAQRRFAPCGWRRPIGSSQPDPAVKPLRRERPIRLRERAFGIMATAPGADSIWRKEQRRAARCGRTAHNGQKRGRRRDSTCFPIGGRMTGNIANYAQQLIVSRIRSGTSTPPFSMPRSAASNSRTSIRQPRLPMQSTAWRGPTVKRPTELYAGTNSTKPAASPRGRCS